MRYVSQGINNKSVIFVSGWEMEPLKGASPTTAYLRSVDKREITRRVVMLTQSHSVELQKEIHTFIWTSRVPNSSTLLTASILSMVQGLRRFLLQLNKHVCAGQSALGATANCIFTMQDLSTGEVLVFMKNQWYTPDESGVVTIEHFSSAQKVDHPIPEEIREAEGRFLRARLDNDVARGRRIGWELLPFQFVPLDFGK